MLLAKEHIVFVVPPVRYDLALLFSGRGSVADAAKFFEKEPTRFIILRKDGSGSPVIIEQPSAMVFHHGNAFERDGKLTIDCCLSPDGSVLQALYSWDKEKLPQMTSPRLTRFVLDPVKGVAESRIEIEESNEFPRFDTRRGGTEARYLYTLESKNQDDFFALTTIVKTDLQKRTSKRVDGGKNRVYGEPVFVPHPTKEGEDQGWIVAQGYDGAKDDNFVEIRDAVTLDFEARIWTGNHFPLGFHGNFYPNVIVPVEISQQK
jgi:all-trans-8'-apo-beta-carotenal 15,15'-oxygenase